MDKARVDRVALIVGVALLALAALIWWDASRMTLVSNYGIGPTAAPRIVSLFLVALGIGHFITAFKEGVPEPDEAHWSAVGWVSAALAALIAALWFGAGFIIGSTLLFALTARAFGRRALPADLAIGFVLAVAIYFLFNNLLTLSLPQGPLERLL